MQTQATTIAADTIQHAADTAAWTATGWESIMSGDGLMISAIGIIVVFLSLAFLIGLIRTVGKFVLYSSKKKQPPQPQGVPKPANGISGELVAAVAMALHEHLYALHDEEKTIITIKKISKPYSPWSSKLYNMTRGPLHSIKRG